MIESKRRTDIALGLYGLQPSKPGVALKDYLPKFLEWAKTQNLAPDTTKAYREHLMPILAYKPLADCRLNLMDEALIEEYKKRRLKTVAVATVNNELRALRR